jgi:hypothetical protein
MKSTIGRTGQAGAAALVLAATSTIAFSADNANWLDNTISPVSNPIFFEDPKITSEIHPVYMYHIATVVWGIVGMLVGLLASVQLFFPDANLNFQFITFGRIRPLHTNAVIFAFVGNGMFMGIYCSLQRLCQARLFNDFISWFHFWGLISSTFGPVRITCFTRALPDWA